MMLLSGGLNATADLTMDGADGLLVTLFFLILVAAGVGGLLVAYTSLRGYKRFRRVMDWIGSFVRWVFLGLPLGVVLGFGGWGVWYVATADASTQAMVWEWVWNGALVAVVLACLGWVTERVLTRFDEHKAALEEGEEDEEGETEGEGMLVHPDERCLKVLEAQTEVLSTALSNAKQGSYKPARLQVGTCITYLEEVEKALERLEDEEGGG